MSSFLFRVNFMQIPLTSLLHFLNTNYFMLSNIISYNGNIISWSKSMFSKLNLSKFYLIYFIKFSLLIESLSSNDISSKLPLSPSSTIHSLGFTFASLLYLIPQIKSVSKSSFFHLHRIKILKLLLYNLILKLLAFSLFLSRFHYFNFLYYVV